MFQKYYFEIVIISKFQIDYYFDYLVLCFWDSQKGSYGMLYPWFLVSLLGPFLGEKLFLVWATFETSPSPLHRENNSVLGAYQASQDNHPPSKMRKMSRGCQPFRKYIHSMDHRTSSIKKLLLRHLMLNFLSATVSSDFPQVDCTFQNRSTNRLQMSKWSEFIA